MLKMRAIGYEMIAISSPGEPLVALREKDGFRTYEVPMARHISLPGDIKSLFRMMKVFRKEKPTMVHSMTPKAGLLCMMAAWMTRVPVRIHTFTGLVWPTSTGLKRKILMATDWLTCACATHVIPEGQGVLNDLKNGGITKKPLRVLGYGNVKGVDMVRFSRRPEIEAKALALRDDSVFTFVFVGRIVRDKGINELIEAFVRLQNQFDKVRLWLIGRFEDSLDPISDSARECIKSTPSIIAIGEQFDDDLLGYYAAADCFVFPSYREGFPNTVLEAGAMDLPSIVTNINGSNEIIVDDENGIIIPSRDSVALYDAMKRVVVDGIARNRMARNARRIIMNRYEQGYVQKCLLDYYEEILA